LDPSSGYDNVVPTRKKLRVYVKDIVLTISSC
jgi:hypothetical protein